MRKILGRQNVLEKLYPERKIRSKNNIREIIRGRINQLKIHPDEALGQHFLVDQNAIDILADSVIEDSIVIEVGAGVGQLTEALAKKAFAVIPIEIDKRYKPVLAKIVKNYPNIRIIYDNALSLKLSSLIGVSKDNKRRQVQIIASLPYHITEPFLHKIADFQMHSAILVVGKRLIYEIESNNEENSSFGQLTLLAQTFFNIEVLDLIDKQKFFPIPRTDSAIVKFTPKTNQEICLDKRNFLLRRLFMTARRSPLVKNSLKEGLIEIAQLNQGSLTQNQARAIVSDMGVADSVLNKPFQQLNNEELKTLSKALRKI